MPASHPANIMATLMSAPLLSVLVSTRDRAQLLEGMLTTLDTEWDDILEVLVVDNGSTDDTPRVLERMASTRPKLRPLLESRPGQSRALNMAIDLASSPALAFVDDDVRIQPGWAAALRRAFATDDHPGFQGRIRLSEAVRSDQERMARWRQYKTFPMVDYGEKRLERRVLTGANMALRAELVRAMGGFDERLGPGAAGLSADTDLARRIRLHTGRAFAYLHDAIVEHVYEEQRLTDAYHESYHRRLGRSRYVEKQPGLVTTILPGLAASWVRWRCSAWGTDLEEIYRRRGRCYCYAEMLKARRAPAR